MPTIESVMYISLPPSFTDLGRCPSLSISIRVQLTFESSRTDFWFGENGAFFLVWTYCMKLGQCTDGFLEHEESQIDRVAAGNVGFCFL